MRLFVDNLTNVDFSYLDGQRGLVGETWLASVEMTGELDEQGMVCDFGLVKKTLRQWLDATIDHCLIVPKDASALSLQQSNARTNIVWQYDNGKLTCGAPDQAITLVDSASISPETVASWCIGRLIKELPESISHLSLTFTPEAINGARYHYSHGLKKHDGNCQRIAHGHRSTIEIYCNDQRNSSLEAEWAAKWQDIYIGTKEDLLENSTKLGEAESASNLDNCAFEYESQQGSFQLSLPAKDCYLIDADTTVENIARHIAGALKKAQPNCRFKVKAFEGIGKGAIGYS